MVNEGQKFVWKLFLAIFLLLLSLYYGSNCFTILYPFRLLRNFCQSIGALIVLIHLSWQLTHFFRRKSQRTHVIPKNRAVLVTGCDTGFGNKICRQLDLYGFHVFAGCLFADGDGANSLRADCSKRVKVVKLDVTKLDDMKNVVQEIKESGLELWAVLNNAGISYFSPIELGKDVEVFEKIFAVNVFGLVRVTKHCLPLLRKSGGRVINMASIAGKFTFSGINAYCMSKFAVRSFSDGLRAEMAPFGVKVVTLEPNLYRTSIMDFELLSKSIDKLWLDTDEEVREFYGNSFAEKLKSRLKSNLVIARPQVYEVIDAQQEAITAEEPDIYYRCAGPGERPALWLLDQVTVSAQDFMLNGIMWKKCLQLFKTNT